ncbi:16S rRNA (uracil(1498)-N(3))-methyltransferase [Parabacteroides sp. OttesenSCG-928-N08]|nr:16S rRNA (uracil(1498)-N(3))-methyltransferase [Parabacteroides sp. OttesenSCG-928-N08]
MQLFYAPDIAINGVLPEEESGHCIRVLRKKAGDIIDIIDGKGSFYKARIEAPHPKRCEVVIVEQITAPRLWNTTIHIAIAPTKHIDRIEWFCEKAVEIGIDAITCLLCRYSERKEIKPARMEKVIVSAAKQSLKATVPLFEGMVDFKSFVSRPFTGKKYIAHCYEGEKQSLLQCYPQGEEVLVLIGPEGDFSEEEVALAMAHGFEAVSLGESRLRTETAALVACHTIHLLNALPAAGSD